MTIYSFFLAFSVGDLHSASIDEFAFRALIIPMNCLGAVANALFVVAFPLHKYGTPRQSETVVTIACGAAWLACFWVFTAWRFCLMSGNVAWLAAFALLFTEVRLLPTFNTDSPDSSSTP
jgi:hypothetical protein